MGGLAQNVQKPPPGKNVQNSQGQIPRSNISGMSRSNFPRSNAKVKNFRNVKVKSQGQIPRSNISGMSRSNQNWETGKNRKNRKKPEKWESVTKIKNHKHLKRY